MQEPTHDQAARNAAIQYRAAIKKLKAENASLAAANVTSATKVATLQSSVDKHKKEKKNRNAALACAQEELERLQQLEAVSNSQRSVSRNESQLDTIKLAREKQAVEKAALLALQKQRVYEEAKLCNQTKRLKRNEERLEQRAAALSARERAANSAIDATRQLEDQLLEAQQELRRKGREINRLKCASRSGAEIRDKLKHKAHISAEQLESAMKQKRLAALSKYRLKRNLGHRLGMASACTRRLEEDNAALARRLKEANTTLAAAEVAADTKEEEDANELDRGRAEPPTFKSTDNGRLISFSAKQFMQGLANAGTSVSKMPGVMAEAAKFFTGKFPDADDLPGPSACGTQANVAFVEQIAIAAEAVDTFVVNANDNGHSVNAALQADGATISFGVGARKVMGNGINLAAIDKKGQVVGQQRVAYPFAIAHGGKGEDEARTTIRASEIMSKAKPPNPLQETKLKDAGFGNLTEQRFGRMHNATVSDTAGPAQVAAQLSLNNSTTNADDHLRIDCACHACDNTCKKSVSAGLHDWTRDCVSLDDAVSLAGQAFDFVPSADDNFGNVRTCLHAIFFNHKKEYGNAADFSHYIEHLETIQDDVGTETKRVLAFVRQASRATGRYMSNVHTDGVIALLWNVIKGYSQGEVFRKKGEVGLNGAHKVVVTALDADHMRVGFLAAALTGEIHQGTLMMVKWTKTVTRFGLFANQLVDELTELLSDESIGTLDASVRAGDGIPLGRETDLWKWKDDAAFVTNKAQQKVSKERSALVRMLAYKSADTVITPVIYILIATLNELKHFLRDYLPGGCLHPLEMTEKQKEIADTTPADNDFMERDFGKASEIIKQFGSTISELAITGRTLQSANPDLQSARYTKRSLAEMLARQVHFEKVVPMIKQMYKDDNDAKASRKRADRTKGAATGKAASQARVAKARASVALMEKLTEQQFEVNLAAVIDGPRTMQAICINCTTGPRAFKWHHLESKEKKKQAAGIKYMSDVLRAIKDVHGGKKELVQDFKGRDCKLKDVEDIRLVQLFGEKAKGSLILNLKGKNGLLRPYWLLKQNVLDLIRWTKNMTVSFQLINPERKLHRRAASITTVLTPQGALAKGLQGKVITNQKNSNLLKQKGQATLKRNAANQPPPLPPRHHATEKGGGEESFTPPGTPPSQRMRVTARSK